MQIGKAAPCKMQLVRSVGNLLCAIRQAFLSCRQVSA